MKNKRDLVADFTSFAKLQLDNSTAQLKTEYKDKNKVTESVKLKVFNEHFQTLKGHLDNKKTELLGYAPGDSATKLKLEEIYNQYIDDFLKGDFNIK